MHQVRITDIGGDPADRQLRSGQQFTGVFHPQIRKIPARRAMQMLPEQTPQSCGTGPQFIGDLRHGEHLRQIRFHDFKGLLKQGGQFVINGKRQLRYDAE